MSKLIKKPLEKPIKTVSKTKLSLSIIDCATEIGMTTSAFRYYLSAGKIKANKFNRYDPDTCKQDIKNYVETKIKRFTIQEFPEQSRKIEKPEPEPESEPAQEERQEFKNYENVEENLRSSSLAHAGVNGNRSLAEANRIQAWQKVQREQLESDIRVGKYVPLEEVNQYISTMQLKARDLFLRIAPELKDQIAQESDPINVEYMITLEINRALSEMAEMKQEVVNIKMTTGTVGRPRKTPLETKSETKE